MSASRSVDPGELRQSLLAVVGWLRGGAPEPTRKELAAAVRLSLRNLAINAPGHSVEVRVPPFAAVQCVEGPSQRRGTPPNVVETDPRTWLALAIGQRDWADAVADGSVTASGTRADLSHWLPIARV